MMRLETNSRIPAQLRGDLRAQIASCTAASRGLTQLIEKYGSDGLPVQGNWLRCEQSAAPTRRRGYVAQSRHFPCTGFPRQRGWHRKLRMRVPR
ncbi:MAG: hydantoinase B/oxoprolinase family protein [Paraburkholderia sp.]|uniref:hydantoinase B/oxoprolinase family protein n=1 Tax=Paraburkholderia sp. TaxID=1926495 RepID=UPI003C49BED2